MQFLKNHSIKKFLCVGLACASILSFSACGNKEPSDNNSSSDISSSISENRDKNDKDKDKSSSDASSKTELDKDVAEKLQTAIGINSDVVGWITIPNTQIDNEVLQSNDNEFYHRRDINKNYEWYGCYYADKQSVIKDKKSLSPNTVIYGHNMEDRPNGKKFAQLMNYLDEDFAKNNPYIYVQTPDEKLIFQVYAVFYTDTSFQYHLVDPVKDTEKLNKKITLGDIINEAKSRSEYIYDVEVDGSDKIITLSTCTYKFGGEANKEQRFVIQGRLLRDGEKEEKTVSLKKNPSPKAPTFSKNYN